MESCVRLDHRRRQRDCPNGQGCGGQICGREEDRGWLPDELMAIPGGIDRTAKEAAATPPSSSVTDRLMPSSSAAPILSVNNIEVVYDHVILVLKGVSLAVPAGEIVALLGANGAGKSTTLKAISNLISAERGEVTKGSIVFDGEEVHARSPNELVR